MKKILPVLFRKENGKKPNISELFSVVFTQNLRAVPHSLGREKQTHLCLISAKSFWGSPTPNKRKIWGEMQHAQSLKTSHKCPFGTTFLVGSELPGPSSVTRALGKSPAAFHRAPRLFYIFSFMESKYKAISMLEISLVSKSLPKMYDFALSDF